MLKLRVLLCTLALMMAGMSACIFDPGKPVVPPPPPLPQLKDLTQPEHVMLNMELAYNNRKIQWYDGLLDQKFVFFLSPGDVGGGLPDQWDRPTEITTNTNLFNKNYTGAHPCQSVFLDIRTEDGIAWTDFNPASNPTETWKTTTLYYDFKFEIAPDTYIPLPGSKASFTVRDSGPSGNYAHHWQLVEFRDLGGS